jgi:ssDNA-binding Zn-finger/Zn-ribbon topoisomerase 1
MFPVKLNPKVEVSKENLHCPDCKDGYLVVRKGRYGKFIGCTNFPNCTHTEGKNNLKKFKKFEEETRKLEIQPFWDLIDYIYQKNV